MTDDEFQAALEAARQDERQRCAMIAERVAIVQAMGRSKIRHWEDLAALARYIAQRIGAAGDVEKETRT